jgi:hypothetical protein
MVICMYPVGLPEYPVGRLVNVPTPDAGVAVDVFKTCCGVVLVAPRVAMPAIEAVPARYRLLGLLAPDAPIFPDPSLLQIKLAPVDNCDAGFTNNCPLSSNWNRWYMAVVPTWTVDRVNLAPIADEVCACAACTNILAIVVWLS